MRLRRRTSLLSLSALVAVAALPLLAAVPATAAPSTGVVISEVYGGGGNSGATLKNDFIELYNLGSTPVSLSGSSVAYFSASGGSGGSTALTGTLQPGTYYLIRESAGMGGSEDGPPPDVTGTISMSATSGRVDLLRGSTLVDRVGYGTATSSEGAAAPGLSNTTSDSRTPVTQDTDSNSADFKAGTPSPTNSGGTAGGGGGTSACNPSGTVTLISAVQGSGATSPCVGSSVTIDGVVVGRDDLIGSSFGSGNTINRFPRDRGFYVQEETADSDGNAATSEGVFVGLPTAATALPAIGDRVKVTGQVQDGQGAPVFGQTAIYPADASGVVTEASGQPLPAPVTLDTATANGQSVGTESSPTRGYYETVEDMLVTLPVGVANSGGTNKFGELFLIPGTTQGTLLRTDPVAPGLIATAQDAGAGNPDNPFNPPAPSTTIAQADKGDTVRGLTGPLGYSFGNYKVVPQVGQLPAVEKTGVAFPYDRLPAAQPGQVRIASFNQENLFPTGGALDGSIVTAAEFDERLGRASNAIGSLLKAPDVVAVQEIGDTRGNPNAAPQFTSEQTLQRLAARLGTDGYGVYTAVAREGNDTRGIDVGFLVKATVAFTNVVQYNPDAPSGLPAACSDAAGKTFNRTPLSIDVTAPGAVGTFTIVTNHFASKGNPPACAEAQGTAVHDIVVGLRNQGKRVVANGDLNSFEDEQPLTNLQAGDVLRNQFTKAAERDRYSFQFNGLLQTLDHQLVTPDLEPLVTNLTYAHLDNDYYERASQTDGHANSDHDPPVLTLGTATPSPALPEAPYAVLLAVAALAAGGLLVARRHHRGARVAAA